MQVSVAGAVAPVRRSVNASRVTAGAVAAVAGCLAVAAIGLAVANGVTPLVALEDYAVPTLLVGTALSVVGTVVALQRPRLPLGWYLQVAALACLIAPVAAQWARAALVTHAVALPAGEAAAAVAAFGWPVSAVLLFAGLPLMFPEGRPKGRLGASGAIAGVGALVLMALGSGFTAGPSANLPEVPNPLGVAADWPGILEAVGVALVLTSLVLATISLLLRYRRSGDLDRIRIRIFVAVVVLLTLSDLVLPAVMSALLGTYPDWLDSLTETVFGTALVVAVGVAVLRHHLHDIDVVVNRAAVYAVMTALVTAIYVVIVAYSASALGVRGTAPEFVATIVAALCFEPARRRVQSAVNRIFYGQREDPGGLLARLDDRLEGAESVESLLGAVATAASEGLRLPFAAAIIDGDDGTTRSVTSGHPSGATVLFPVHFGRTRVGAVEVAPRRTERELSERDRRALLDYARHAGPALYAARLSGELVGARSRIVTTREAERRRLRRDLHDGLGADLGSQAIVLDAIRRLVRSDPARAEQLLLDAREHTQAAVLDLRRVLDDLRPAVLDDHGLAAALEALVDRYEAGPIGVELETELAVEPPPAVQTAVLRIVAEALNNAVRHSGATLCSVRVSGTDSAVSFSVRDDGRGISEDRPRGVGLSSMRERAAELGAALSVRDVPDGGALVSATIPFPEDPR